MSGETKADNSRNPTMWAARTRKFRSARRRTLRRRDRETKGSRRGAVGARRAVDCASAAHCLLQHEHERRSSLPFSRQSVSVLERLVTAVHLTVGRILNLEPARRIAALKIRAAGVLGDDALKVVLTYQIEQLSAAFVEIINVAYARFYARHYLKQPAFPFKQRQPAQVFTVDLERIECVKERRAMRA